MIALDPDVDRLIARMPGAWPNKSLSLWLSHAPTCWTSGHQNQTCTCGLVEAVDNLQLRSVWDEFDQTWRFAGVKPHTLLALEPWLHHLPHCDRARGGNCCCGLHTEYPMFWRT